MDFFVMETKVFLALMFCSFSIINWEKHSGFFFEVIHLNYFVYLGYFGLWWQDVICFVVGHKCKVKLQVRQQLDIQSSFNTNGKFQCQPFMELIM